MTSTERGNLASDFEDDNGLLLTNLPSTRPLPKLTRIQTLGVPGIFDMKWSLPFTSYAHGGANKCRHGGLLGAALADGTLRGYRLAGDDDGYTRAESATLRETCSCPAFPGGSGMALSLDWAQTTVQVPMSEATEDGASTIGDIKVAVSSSSGYCSVIKVRGHP